MTLASSPTDCESTGFQRRDPPRKVVPTRLLFLSQFCPMPANNGTKIRTWALLRALAAEGHEITLLTFADPREVNGHFAAVEQICRHVEWLPHALKSLSSSKDYLGRFTHLFSRLPYGVRGARSIMMEQRIRALLQDQKIDAIVCEQTDLLVNLPAGLLVPLVVDHHDLQHVILRRYLKFERNPVKRLYAWGESRKVRAWEQLACQRAAIAIACSEHDRALLAKLCPALPIAVVPNVVDTGAYVVNGETDGELFRVLFQGAMDWYPNRDAVEFFVSAILPKLRALAPRIPVTVAGRNLPENFRDRFTKASEVEFIGMVPDMGAEIARASVCIVPLRIGSGTRLKILEAAAMGKPIVSTRIGAEGLDFVDGEEIVLADEPWEFARAIADLLANPARRRTMGLAARRRVETQYSLPALQSTLREVLAQLMAMSSMEFTPASSEVRR